MNFAVSNPSKHYYSFFEHGKWFDEKKCSAVVIRIRSCSPETFHIKCKSTLIHGSHFIPPIIRESALSFFVISSSINFECICLCCVVYVCACTIYIKQKIVMMDKFENIWKILIRSAISMFYFFLTEIFFYTFFFLFIFDELQLLIIIE